jgi:hypothetical protein
LRNAFLTGGLFDSGGDAFVKNGWNDMVGGQLLGAD